jgi:hypothetical protein
MISEYHQGIDWKHYLVIDQGNMAYGLMINGGSVFVGKTDRLTM